jgi:hypothetical protein
MFELPQAKKKKGDFKDKQLYKYLLHTNNKIYLYFTHTFIK